MGDRPLGRPCRSPPRVAPEQEEELSNDAPKTNRTVTYNSKRSRSSHDSRLRPPAKSSWSGGIHDCQLTFKEGDSPFSSDWGVSTCNAIRARRASRAISRTWPLNTPFFGRNRPALRTRHTARAFPQSTAPGRRASASLSTGGRTMKSPAGCCARQTACAGTY